MICNNLNITPAGHLTFAGRDTVELAKSYGTPAILSMRRRFVKNAVSTRLR